MLLCWPATLGQFQSIVHLLLLSSGRNNIINFNARLNVLNTNEMLLCWPTTLGQFQSIMHCYYCLAAEIVNFIARLNVLNTNKMLLCWPTTLGQFQSILHLHAITWRTVSSRKWSVAFSVNNYTFCKIWLRLLRFLCMSLGWIFDCRSRFFSMSRLFQKENI